MIAGDGFEKCVVEWNNCLHVRAEAFVVEASEATVSLLSSHKVLSDVVDDPWQYDFTEDDTLDKEGAIWEDELHISRGIHAIFADKFMIALGIR